MTQTPPISAEQVEVMQKALGGHSIEQLTAKILRRYESDVPPEKQFLREGEDLVLIERIRSITAAASIPASREAGTTSREWPKDVVGFPIGVWYRNQLTRKAAGYGDPGPGPAKVLEIFDYAQSIIDASPAPQPVQEQEPVAELTAVQKLAVSMTDEKIADGLDQECETILQLLIYGQEHQVAEHVGALKSWSGMLRGRASRLPPASPPEQEKYDAVVAGFDRLAATQNEIVHQITARAEAAEAKVERLTEALKPFAKLGEEAEWMEKPDDKGAWGFDDVILTWGDFRRARAALGDTP